MADVSALGNLRILDISGYRITDTSMLNNI